MDRPLQAERDSIRIPLYGDDNQRQYNPYSSLGQQDNVLFNCMAHKNKETGEWIVQKRQGIRTGTNVVLSGKVNNANTCIPLALIGTSQVNLTFVAAYADTSDSKLYIIAFGGAHGTGVVIGSIAAWGLGSGLVKVFLTEIQLATVPYIVVTAQNYQGTSSVAYYAATTAGAFTAASLTQITDVDYPGNIAGECTMGPFVQLNDHTFIMGRSGKVYNSDVGSISSWNARGVISSYIEPDKGQGLCKYKQHLMAFGENSIEFFEDAGLAPPGGPLQRTEQAFIKFGTINSSSFCNIADTIYWLGAGGHKTTGLWKLDQYTPVKISSTWIDNYIYPLGAYLRLNPFYMAGRQHIAIAGIAGNLNTIEPLLAANATFTSSGADAETDPITNFDLTSGMLIHDISGESWWAWSDPFVADMTFYSAQNFASLGLVNPKQVFLKGSGLVTTAGIRGSVGYELYDGLGDQQFFFDVDYNGTTTSGVCVIIQGQPIEFVTRKRKFIHKMQVVMDGLNSDDLYDTGSFPRMYFLFERLDGQASVDQSGLFSRNIDILNAQQRYYINRLGAFRKFYWSIVMKNKQDFRGRAIELEVSQGLS